MSFIGWLITFVLIMQIGEHWLGIDPSLSEVILLIVAWAVATFVEGFIGEIRR